MSKQGIVSIQFQTTRIFSVWIPNGIRSKRNQPFTSDGIELDRNAPPGQISQIANYLKVLQTFGPYFSEYVDIEEYLALRLEEKKQ